MKKLLKCKTFWAGVSSIVTGAIMIYFGKLQEGAVTIISGLGLIFMRDALLGKDN